MARYHRHYPFSIRVGHGFYVRGGFLWIIFTSLLYFIGALVLWSAVFIYRGLVLICKGAQAWRASRRLSSGS